MSQKFDSKERYVFSFIREIYLRAYVINSFDYIDHLAILRCCIGRDEA